jgi:SHS2 domain-containing protein
MSSEMDIDYEYLEHTADVRFRAYGKSLEQAFENAALAMLNVMVETCSVNYSLSLNI